MRKNIECSIKRPVLEPGGWPQFHTVGGLRASRVTHENPFSCLFPRCISRGCCKRYVTVNMKVFQ